MGGEQQQTCGRGLAAQAELPANLAALFIAMAENLDAHLPTLVMDDPHAQGERHVYVKLGGEMRRMAASLQGLARHLSEQATLPAAKHDMDKMLSADILGAFERYVGTERSVAQLLAARVQRDAAMLEDMKAIRESF
jgi:hypothetical protein